MPNLDSQMCSSLSGDARIFLILWICRSVVAALANGQKRMTKGMSALLNYGFWQLVP
jgi:hypothetical protein